jgi:hypothetical protein
MPKFSGSIVGRTKHGDFRSPLKGAWISVLKTSRQRNIWAIALFLLAMIQAPTFAKSGWENDDLKGSVKIKTEITYNVDGLPTSYQKELYGKEITQYDKAGRYLSFEVFRADGSLDLKRTYVCIGVNAAASHTFGADGAMKYMQSNFYDKNNNRVKSIFFKPPGTVASVTLLDYDDRGNLLSSIRKDAVGALLGKTLNEYDLNGNKISHQIFKKDGLLDNRGEYSYKKIGVLSKWREFSGSDEPLMNWESTFDDKGKISGWLQRNRTGMPGWKEVFVYDAKGNLVEDSGYRVLVISGNSMAYMSQESMKKTRVITYEYWE